MVPRTGLSLAMVILSSLMTTTTVLAYSQTSQRRQFLHQNAAALLVGSSVLTANQPAVAMATKSTNTNAGELPLGLRDYTKLAPLGNKATNSTEKTRGLSINTIATRLEHDLVHGASDRGGYIVSGDLSWDLFRDDCVFVDPTNRVASLSQYQRALGILFDPDQSTVTLLDPLQQVVVDDSGDIILQGRFRSHGVLQLPWHPRVTAYESTISYRLDADGLVQEQSQVWTKSAGEALRETFTPGWFLPVPVSRLPRPPNEPEAVTRLFDTVNGRRLDDYSPAERRAIDEKVTNVIATTLSNSIDQNEEASQLLPGTWRLVYLQPGPNGAGIDRRIPFPDFAFNNNFQIFSSANDDSLAKRGTIVNRGELLGPWLQVQVRGEWEALVPPRFAAHIQGGQLCASHVACASLPITGEGLFESLYIGKRLRIGQNLNGGGARIVQVRME